MVGGKYITVEMTAPIDRHAIADAEDDFNLTIFQRIIDLWRGIATNASINMM